MALVRKVKRGQSIFLHNGSALVAELKIIDVTGSWVQVAIQAPAAIRINDERHLADDIPRDPNAYGAALPR